MIAVNRPEDSNVYSELRIMNPNALVAKGLSEAYIGHSSGVRPVAVYDYETCVEIIMVENCMTYEQAADYLGEHTVPEIVAPDLPIFVVSK
jgi:hypothetical protein